jgi:hypothetical protein
MTMSTIEERAAEARHGGRYITHALAKTLQGWDASPGLRVRFAGEDGPEKLAEIWRYTASPSDSITDGRDTTARYAQDQARIGGVEWEHSAYYHPKGLPELAFDWPIYRAARGDEPPYEDVRSSFVLALEGAGVDADLIHEATTTVDDYIDNHYG